MKYDIETLKEAIRMIPKISMVQEDTKLERAVRLAGLNKLEKIICEIEFDKFLDELGL